MEEQQTAQIAPKADRKGVENLVRPVVEGIEAIIRAELEQKDRGRFARIVNLCNQAKSIIDLTRCEATCADFDDDLVPGGAPGMLGVPRIGGGFVRPLGGFGPGYDPGREVLGMMRDMGAPLLDKIATAQADEKRARELQVLLEAREQLDAHSADDRARLKKLEVRIDALLEPRAGPAPGSFVETQQALSSPFHGGPNVAAGEAFRRAVERPTGAMPEPPPGCPPVQRYTDGPLAGMPIPG